MGSKIISPTAGAMQPVIMSGLKELNLLPERQPLTLFAPGMVHAGQLHSGNGQRVSGAIDPNPTLDIERHSSDSWSCSKGFLRHPFVCVACACVAVRVWEWPLQFELFRYAQRREPPAGSLRAIPRSPCPTTALEALLLSPEREKALAHATARSRSGDRHVVTAVRSRGAMRDSIDAAIARQPPAQVA